MNVEPRDRRVEQTDPVTEQVHAAAAASTCPRALRLSAPAGTLARAMWSEAGTVPKANGRAPASSGSKETAPVSCAAATVVVPR